MILDVDDPQDSGLIDDEEVTGETRCGDRLERCGHAVGYDLDANRRREAPDRSECAVLAEGVQERGVGRMRAGRGRGDQNAQEDKRSCQREQRSDSGCHVMLLYFDGALQLLHDLGGRSRARPPHVRVARTSTAFNGRSCTVLVGNCSRSATQAACRRYSPGRRRVYWTKTREKCGASQKPTASAMVSSFASVSSNKRLAISMRTLVT